MGTFTQKTLKMKYMRVLIMIKWNYRKFRQWWYEHDSIELVLFAALFSCLAWATYQVIIALIGRFW